MNPSRALLIQFVTAHFELQFAAVWIRLGQNEFYPQRTLEHDLGIARPQFALLREIKLIGLNQRSLDPSGGTYGSEAGDTAGIVS